MDTTDAQAALHAAIEALYAAFARYPLRPRVEGCPCCVDEGDVERLHGRPLRALTADDLGNYAFSALYTWGTLDDFKHFLPRLLELVAHEPEWWVDPEVVTGRLSYAGWRDWPEPERAAIEAYFGALWRFVLVADPGEAGARHIAVGSGLCAIAQAADELGPFLDQWRRACHEETAALWHLARYVNGNAAALFQKGKLDGSFWREREGPMGRVIAWLLDPLTAAALERGFFEHHAAPFAGDLAAGVDNLAWVRSARRLAPAAGARGGGEP